MRYGPPARSPLLELSLSLSCHPMSFSPQRPDGLRGDELPQLLTAVPGPSSVAWVERLSQVECPAITARRDRRRADGGSDPIVWAAARGAVVVDTDGNRFVDLSGGFGVGLVGHAHPLVVEAAQRQLHQLVHGMGDLFPSREKILLGEKLAAITPADLQQSVFGLTGADAVEIAIKTAMIATGRSRVLAFSGSYHGMSLGALGVSGYRDDFRSPFSSFAGARELRLPYANCGDCPMRQTWPGCDTACLRYVEQLLRSPVSGVEDVAAIIVEPIQARGGDIVPPDGWLQQLRDLCTRAGILLIADEIYTGFGRTGAWFACEHEDVVPDILCVGKAMGGGFPISACIGRPDVMAAWGHSRGESIHTSTFLGNPLGCAMALATIDVIESEGLVDRASDCGAWLLNAITDACADIPCAGVPRGRGMLIGIPILGPDGNPMPAGGVTMMQRLLSRGFITSPAGPMGDVLSLSPPVTITRVQLEAFVQNLRQELHSLSDLA